MGILKDDITPILIVATATSVIIAWFLRDISYIINVNIMFFAIIEALSTYLQVIDGRKQRRFQHLQTELEKCYGPLWITLIRPEEAVFGTETEDGPRPALSYRRAEKARIDSIFYSYPHLIDEDILRYWENEIKYAFSHDGSVTILTSFVIRVNEAYNERAEEYRQLVNEPPRLSVTEDEA